MKIHLIPITMACVAASATAATEDYYYFPTDSATPPANNTAWAVEPTWAVISGLEEDLADPAIQGENDYIGSLTAPAAYWSQTNDYLYFRTRLNTTTAATGYNTPFGNDVFFVIIDRAATAQRIDYAFSWDVQTATSISKHGLELNVPVGSYTTSTLWSDVQFDDKDGSFGQKYEPDFDTLPTGAFDDTRKDGYVRSTQITDGGGAVIDTFLDIAVSWTYLTATYGAGLKVTDMVPGEEFQVAFATLHTGNDHSALSAATDIIGASTSSTLGSGFSSPIPEPGMLSLLLGAGVLALRRRRR